jgi:hypothetical protein
MVDPRRALVRRGDAHLLEETEVMVVGAARNPQEGRSRVSRLHLEAQHVAVEADTALDVGDPQDQVL